MQTRVQDDHSGCSLGLVNIKTKVASQNIHHILKRNFGFWCQQHLGNTLNDHPVQDTGFPSLIPITSLLSHIFSSLLLRHCVI